MVMTDIPTWPYILSLITCFIDVDSTLLLFIVLLLQQLLRKQLLLKTIWHVIILSLS